MQATGSDSDLTHPPMCPICAAPMTPAAVLFRTSTCRQHGPWYHDPDLGWLHLGDSAQQLRDHAVGCRVCCRSETWNVSAVCDACEADADLNTLDIQELVVTL